MNLETAYPDPPRIDDDYWEYLNEHRECSICGETYHESGMYQTKKHGWCCIECYDYLHSECAGEPDLPEILNS